MTRILLAAGVVLTALAAGYAMPVIPLQPITIAAGASETSVHVDLTRVRRKLLAAADDRAFDISLDLDHIEAAHNPRAFFAVYVHSGKSRGTTVGNVTLFGTGIRDEARGGFQPAHVRLQITVALRHALRHSGKVTITFVAQGAVIDGVTPRSVAAVTIGKPSIIVAPRTRE